MKIFSTKKKYSLAAENFAKDYRYWKEVFAMVLLLGITYWLYRFGFSASYGLDDANNIAGVSGVHDLSGALAYISDGRAGSLGRPLALLTFLLQKESWPGNPSAFFAVNTMIHLINGVLVFWLSYQLTQFFPEKLPQPFWFSIVVSTLWLTLPLHVSASLMVVQRMTTLSSMFMLLGLIGYMEGRRVLVNMPLKAYWIMSGSVLLGTSLASLTKENGALLPVYILIIETAIVNSTVAVAPVHASFKKWKWIFLGVPILLLGAYFIYAAPKILAGYSFRSFSVTERLLTELRILWSYLGQIYFPIRGGTGPFHDDFTVSRGIFDPIDTVLAIIAWVAVILASWWFRRRFPIILYALLWFLAGHIIESSFIPLELYFEHRNYLPSLGPIFAICVLLWNVPFKIQRIARIALVLMIMLRLFTLGETTHLWGEPLVAAKVWVEEHPQSARAAQFLTQRYGLVGNEDAMRKATLDGHGRIKDDMVLALQSVYLSCQVDEKAVFLSRIKEIQPIITIATVSAAAPELLGKMLEAKQKGVCPNLTMEQLFWFADALLVNKHISNTPGIMSALHVFKYQLYALEGKPNLSIRELGVAFSLTKELLIASALARATVEAGHFEDAIYFLDYAIHFAPRNPVLNAQWAAEFLRIRALIERKRVLKQQVKVFN